MPTEARLAELQPRVRDVPDRSKVWRYFDGLGRAH
ncbi:hypothetical protein [Bordetella pertussis]